MGGGEGDPLAFSASSDKAWMEGGGGSQPVNSLRGGGSPTIKPVGAETAGLLRLSWNLRIGSWETVSSRSAPLGGGGAAWLMCWWW